MNAPLEVLSLSAPEPSPYAFDVEVRGSAPRAVRRAFQVTGPAPDGGSRVTREYTLPVPDQAAYLDLFEALAEDFGIRLPLSRRPPPAAEDHPGVRPLLTQALSPDILYGYGDPSVLRVGQGAAAVWWLVCTSNDAPDAFPVLLSRDLVEWTHAGFIFPRGHAPAWALTGADVSDFWAPEMHRVADEFWVCFAAREHDRGLAIGMARGPRPEGPFEPDPEPLVGGGVIDPHIVLDAAGSPWLFWKKDDNDLWPRLLCDLLHRRGGVDALFENEADRRTAALLQTLWPWVRTLEPMEQFFVQQPLIEAVTAEFSAFGDRLRSGAIADGERCAILDALKTRVYAQQLAPDGRSLVGERAVVLENDQPWEAHLIEGVWVTAHAGRYYMLYAGNDFSTPHYGLGAAVADHLLGPYRKLDGPLLRTTGSWAGPGHPSVALGPDGRHHMFLHAFFPGTAAYKAFRALLTAPLELDGDRVRVPPA
ncbi:MAG TPA: family 43 glycosylhydrolase [Caulobacteraceae bacterium]|jgi:hypothetical protein